MNIDEQEIKTANLASFMNFILGVVLLGLMSVIPRADVGH